jgi:hypothetical protein
MNWINRHQQFLFGALLSAGVNGVLNTLLAMFAALIFIGAGMSSNPQTDASNFQALGFVAVCCPGLFNLPGIAYALIKKRWGFLGGWGLGFVLGLLVIAVFAGGIAGIVFLAAASEGIK